MPEINVRAVGARGSHDDLAERYLTGEERDVDETATVNDEPESKDMAPPGSLRWKEQQ